MTAELASYSHSASRHSAPAVSYPVGRSSFCLGLLLAVLSVGAGNLIAWVVVSDGFALYQMAAVLLWLICALGALVLWQRAPTGAITWDGQNWTWMRQDIALPVALCVRLDLQNVLLVYLQPSNAPGQWVWLERRVVPLRWLACRRAVFARQTTTATRDADGVLS